MKKESLSLPLSLSIISLPLYLSMSLLLYLYISLCLYLSMSLSLVSPRARAVSRFLSTHTHTCARTHTHTRTHAHMTRVACYRRVKGSAAGFTDWVRDFMPSLLAQNSNLQDTLAETPSSASSSSSSSSSAPAPAILGIPAVSDRSDARICHLDGLLLSKAWHLRCCARELSLGGVAPAVTDGLLAAADAHYEAASWMATDYVGSHWLHSFALLALDLD